MLYDLSPLVRPGAPVWPGDTRYASRLTARIEEGSPVNVGAFETTTHLGSHVDAPLHTEPRGLDVARLPLEAFVGPCRVVHVPSGSRIEPAHLARVELEGIARLLLRTDSVPDRRRFPERFTVLSPEAAALLVERGVILVGIDTPSVDPPQSKTLETHHTLAQAGVAILEGLVLDAVPEGVYELLALPLRLAGLDASPVRAVLRTLSQPA